MTLMKVGPSQPMEGEKRGKSYLPILGQVNLECLGIILKTQ